MTNYQLPRYSGTSADLVKTCLDLIVSVKLFLGRFDMRTMQVRTIHDYGGSCLICVWCV